MDGWSTVTSAGTAAALAAGVAVVLAFLLIAVLTTQRRTRRELVRARLAHDELLARVTLLEQPVVSQASQDSVEYVITDVDSPHLAEPQEGPGRIDGRLFADVVARETVVKAASWTHGLRHALSAENRNRLRFEMRREARRSGRQRKADVKEALRQYYARERGDVA